MNEKLTKEQLLMALHSLEQVVQSMQGKGRCTTCINFAQEERFCGLHKGNIPEEHLGDGCNSWEMQIPF